ncbi:hydrophobic surface binding protein [Mycena alexandri]|uniref:Hydrophobic surface binding protein n=1 Tax=Mycena alexandri TaxID=1745969 RepID=A0AAD6WS53_9AGAR|nr:hydrophobic surface binding protein [Mycena alexandri]
MVQLSRLLLSLALVAASLATPLKRTVAQIEADLTTLQSQVTSLDNNIKGFPASGLTGALEIHDAAAGLESSLNTATSDVKATPTVSEADATTILNTVQNNIEPLVIDALTRIAGDRAAFDAQPIIGLSALVLVDLQTLKNDTDAFSNALIAAAPADLKTQATAIKTAIDAAFSKAIAAFASA